ncbi:polysaccharide deacetylase family protein [Halosimplex aquaticum]|uniref:Polysaccharide deacetylase family protein n=1 Tax=Halosimplex aquaticum TaxID=3026162 RepID=A0ABD5XV78_9EURY|nr:polysaccharide deacetylase family protein [Halosimplex aquaticum]
MGSVVVSVDAELGWGFVDYDSPPESRVESGRSGWRTLCRLFDAYDVPATWAVVGHLFHEACDGRHPDHPAGPEWFAPEREQWADRPDLTCGPELIERVRESGPDHEIGSHTYSHVLFGDDQTTGDVAAAELARSRAVADEQGIDLRSLVFPRNELGHRDKLAEHGFDAYRGGRPTPRRTLPEKLKTVAFGSGHPPVVTPATDEYGLVNIPASLYLYSFEGPALRATKPFVGDPIVELVERGLDAAAESEGVLHLWLHPNNLVGEPQVRRIEGVLRAIDAHRDEVPVETMAAVAARARAEPKTVATDGRG